MTSLREELNKDDCGTIRAYFMNDFLSEFYKIISFYLQIDTHISQLYAQFQKWNDIVVWLFHPKWKTNAFW